MPTLAPNTYPYRPTVPEPSRQWDGMRIYLFIVGAVSLETIPLTIGDSFRLNAGVASICFSTVVAMRLSRLPSAIKILASRPMFFFMLYAALICTSAGWSYIGPLSLAYTIPIVLLAVAACSLHHLSPDRTAKALIIVSLWVAALSWPVGLLLPEVGAVVPPEWRLNGIMLHCQRLALLMSIAIVVSIIYRQRLGSRRSYCASWPSIVLLATTLAATLTRSFTTFAIVTVLFVFARRLRLFTLAIVAAAACLIIVLLALAQNYLIEAYSRDGVNNETLSGRTTIWQNTWDMALERPWTGYGFGSFYTELTSDFFLNYLAPHAHNDLLNILFETGAVAALLMACFLFYSVIRSLYKSYTYCGPILLYIIACGITGVIVGGKASTAMAILLVFAAQELSFTRSYPRNPVIAKYPLQLHAN
ncbi:O-antigen ligase family protein [Geminicoccus roseus]|uniref:O-antigen ligase family protein n=1 Tax=Geminicoccus roseus TaxID=404900 RepID=UPI0009FFDF4C